MTAILMPEGELVRGDLAARAGHLHRRDFVSFAIRVLHLNLPFLQPPDQFTGNNTALRSAASVLMQQS